MNERRDVSPTMQAAIGLALEGGGKLIRLQGGFWVKPGTGWLSRNVPNGPYFGGSTINALISRDLVTVTQRAGKAQFPIEIEVRSTPGHKER